VTRENEGLLVVDRRATRWLGTAADWHGLARLLEDRTCVHLPAFLDAGLLEEVLDLVDQARFVEHRHGTLAIDERAEPGPLSALLLLLPNDPELLRLVGELTGCGRVDGFEGRIYRMRGGDSHFDSWHSDSGGNRRAAISINLNRAVVATAPLQIRRRDSETILHEFANARPGDAVLFTVDDDHVHRVKPMPGVGPRVACSGWFYRGADFVTRIREEASRAQSSSTRSKT
jgi:hypothetical protein